MAIAKTTFSEGTIVEPNFLNDVPLLNLEDLRIETSVVMANITAYPTPTWNLPPVDGTSAILLHKRGQSGRQNCLVFGSIKFWASSSIAYLIIPLPTGHRPVTMLFAKTPFVKCGVIHLSESVEGVIAKVSILNDLGVLYVGNSTMDEQLSNTAETFAANNTYRVSLCLEYPIMYSE